MGSYRLLESAMINGSEVDLPFSISWDNVVDLQLLGNLLNTQM
jgi:hypothetical protein